jgi:hypothetical protein
MTNLERLIEAHVQATTITTLSAATERLTEELAREFLKDPKVRAELHALVDKHFGATMTALRTNGRRPKRARRESKRARR